MWSRRLGHRATAAGSLRLPATSSVLGRSGTPICTLPVGFGPIAGLGYRAIRDDAFPAVRVRSRYIVPAAAVEEMVAQALSSGICVDVAEIAARRRLEREAAHALGSDGGTRSTKA